MLNLLAIRNNEDVLKCNDLPVERTTFSEVYGGLCGSDDAVLIDESLEELFELSEITCEYSNQKKFAILMQNGKSYRVNIVSCDEGSTDESDHFDFRTIELVK